MTHTTGQSESVNHTAATAISVKPAHAGKRQRQIRRWRIMIPIVYLFFILFFFLITSLCLASGSMFLIIFGPLLAGFCLITGPALLIAFRRPDACYHTGKPQKPLSQRSLCLILLLADFLAVVLLITLWLLF